MLPKKNRVSSKEVEDIFKRGSYLNSPSLTFKYIRNNAKEAKISFIAPKSVAKLAVKRNLLRRRGYDAIKKNSDLFPSDLVGVFIYKKSQEDLLMLANEVKNIFSKIN
ncbi:MAG: ribonuclease P protein component [bacterium]